MPLQGMQDYYLPDLQEESLLDASQLYPTNMGKQLLQKRRHGKTPTTPSTTTTNNGWENQGHSWRRTHVCGRPLRYMGNIQQQGLECYKKGRRYIYHLPRRSPPKFLQPNPKPDSSPNPPTPTRSPSVQQIPNAFYTTAYLHSYDGRTTGLIQASTLRLHYPQRAKLTSPLHMLLTKDPPSKGDPP